MYACRCRLASDSKSSLVEADCGFGFVTAALACTAVELEQPHASAQAAKQMSLTSPILKPEKFLVMFE